MKKLHDLTKDWTNLPDIVFNYTNGVTYGGIKTSEDGVTSITMMDGTPTLTLTELKTRMTSNEELVLVGCDTSIGAQSCPGWINRNNATYWTLSTSSISLSRAYFVENAGFLYYVWEVANGTSALRPVITVPISELSQ